MRLYIYIYIYTNICINIRISMYMCIHTYISLTRKYNALSSRGSEGEVIYKYIYIYIHMSTYIYMYMCIYIHTSVGHANTMHFQVEDLKARLSQVQMGANSKIDANKLGLSLFVSLSLSLSLQQIEHDADIRTENLQHVLCFQRTKCSKCVV